jgi:hypothetical protein
MRSFNYDWTASKWLDSGVAKVGFIRKRTQLHLSRRVPELAFPKTFDKAEIVQLSEEGPPLVVSGRINNRRAREGLFRAGFP